MRLARSAFAPHVLASSLGACASGSEAGDGDRAPMVPMRATEHARANELGQATVPSAFAAE